MASFDGENLIITLDPVVDGVLDVDVGIDLYTEWKTWMKQGNMRYPEAFRTTGGDELTSIINAGSYYFLRNDYGWRVKPYENDGTYYMVGNLAAQDTTLPALTPTDGGYTAAILGLQPVTQGVTDSMASQLEFNTFQGAICVDVVGGYAGTGDISGSPIGTRKTPSDNIVDAHTIGNTFGLASFNIINSMTLSSEDLSDGHSFRGDSPFLTLAIDPSADVTNCSLENLTISGQLDGLNVVARSFIDSITDVSGIFEKCAFQSTIVLNGDTDIFECYSRVPGGGYPTFDVGANAVTVRDYRGSIGILGATTGHLSSIGVYGGRIVIDSTCVGGTIHVRGEPFEIVDNSGAGCTVIDETEGAKVRSVHQANFNRRKHDAAANTITIYDADNVTPLHVFDATDDLTDITPI